jgi:putative tricarboxylic transport membrane protein
VDPTQVNYIAYSGGGEALAAILGNQVTVGISGISEFLPQVAGG